MKAIPHYLNYSCKYIHKNTGIASNLIKVTNLVEEYGVYCNIVFIVLYVTTLMPIWNIKSTMTLSPPPTYWKFVSNNEHHSSPLLGGGGGLWIFSGTTVLYTIELSMNNFAHCDFLRSPYSFHWPVSINMHIKSTCNLRARQIRPTRKYL